MSARHRRACGCAGLLAPNARPTYWRTGNRLGSCGEPSADLGARYSRTAFASAAPVAELAALATSNANEDRLSPPHATASVASPTQVHMYLPSSDEIQTERCGETPRYDVSTVVCRMSWCPRQSGTREVESHGSEWTYFGSFHTFSVTTCALPLVPWWSGTHTGHRAAINT